MSEDKSNQYEIGKAYYVKYDGSNMSYKEWSEKSEAMTATRMEGYWAAVEHNYDKIIEKSNDSTKVLTDNEEECKPEQEGRRIPDPMFTETSVQSN